MLLFVSVTGYKYLHQNFSGLNQQCNINKCKNTCEPSETTKSAINASSQLNDCLICNSDLLQVDIPEFYFFLIKEIKSTTVEYVCAHQNELKINFDRKSARAPPFVITFLAIH